MVDLLNILIPTREIIMDYIISMWQKLRAVGDPMALEIFV